MEEYNYNEINKRAIAPNLLKSYGIDIEKGGEGSGRHKVGDIVVDKEGKKGKVTHADDKEVAVEHDNGDVTGYRHDQVKKQDSKVEKGTVEKGKTMKVNTKEMIDEHKKLTEVLDSPSHEDDKEESKDQKKELKKYKEKLKKSFEMLGISNL